MFNLIMNLTQRPSPKEWTHNRTIQALRGFSVLLVFISHTSLMPDNRNWGIIGVCVFFVISGYVITGNLLEILDVDHQQHTKLKPFLTNFYQRRIQRLLPLSILVLFIVISYELIFHVGNPKEYLLAGIFIFFYIPNFFGLANLGYSDLPSGLGHYWSLGVEEQFYLLWPLVLFLLFHKFGKTKLLYTTSTLAILFLFLHFLPPALDITVWTLPTSYADLLLFGCVLAIANRYFVLHFGIKFDKFLKSSFAVVSIVILLLMPRNSHLVSLGFDFVIRTMLIGLFFVCILQIKFENGFLEKIGDISYGFYLIHVPILIMLERMLNNGFAVALIGWIATFYLSRLSYDYFEARFRIRMNASK